MMFPEKHVLFPAHGIDLSGYRALCLALASSCLRVDERLTGILRRSVECCDGFCSEFVPFSKTRHITP